MYDDHLRLIGKRVVDFLLVLIELFSLGVMAEELRATSSQKTRTTALSYGIKIWTDLSTVLSQFTRVTDRRMDKQTEFSSLDLRLPYMQCGKNENSMIVCYNESHLQACPFIASVASLFLALVLVMTFI